MMGLVGAPMSGPRRERREPAAMAYQPAPSGSAIRPGGRCDFPPAREQACSLLRRPFGPARKKRGASRVRSRPRREPRCKGGLRGEQQTRKPLLLFVFVGSFLLRLADRQFLGLLFQDPPRNTRTEPPAYPLEKDTPPNRAWSGQGGRHMRLCASLPVGVGSQPTLLVWMARKVCAASPRANRHRA